MKPEKVSDSTRPIVQKEKEKEKDKGDDDAQWKERDYDEEEEESAVGSPKQGPFLIKGALLSSEPTRSGNRNTTTTSTTPGYTKLYRIMLTALNYTLLPYIALYRTVLYCIALYWIAPHSLHRTNYSLTLTLSVFICRVGSTICCGTFS